MRYHEEKIADFEVYILGYSILGNSFLEHDILGHSILRISFSGSVTSTLFCTKTH